MREILFRGKAKTITPTYEPIGTWVYGFYNEIDNKSIIQSKKYNCEVEKDTVGQFTGLTDKNGKKIFEGDIVKTKYGRLCKVVWFSSPCHCGWDLEVILIRKNIGTIPPDSYDLWHKNNLEIIGNIHDNPELLGE